MTGERLYNKAGKKRFGKHSWRSTGAVHLGECGLETNKISLMGRWFCAVVLHYTRLAPIKNIARDLKRAKTREGIDETVANINKSQQKVKLAVDGMMVSMRAEVNALQQRIEEVDREAKAKTHHHHQVHGESAQSPDDDAGHW